MSDDAPVLPNRKSKTRRWIALAALLFLAWFLWQLFSPTPPIIVSTETTYITEPLRPDGQPDYVAYLGNKSRAGVTRENNAAVLLWQVFGPGQNISAIQPAHWLQIAKEFELPSNDPKTYFAEAESGPTATIIGNWLYENSAGWKREKNAPPNPDYPLLTSEELGSLTVGNAMSAPWRASDIPPLAEWIAANSDAINLLVEASRRPMYYTPLKLPEPGDKNYLIATMPLNGIQRSRAAARVLSTRAMLRIGEGQYAEAWQDLLAIHRWARLIAQGPTTVDQLVGIAIDNIACYGDAELLARSDLSIGVARQIHEDLRGLGPVTNLADGFNEGERLYFLDAIAAYHSNGIGNLVADSFYYDRETGDWMQPDWKIALLSRVSADWNVGLAEANRWFDRLTAAASLPQYADRKREFANLRHEFYERKSSLAKSGNWLIATFYSGKRNEMLAAAMLVALSPAFDAKLEVNNRAQATFKLTQLAAALAVYRAEHGNYPDQLDELVPDTIPELPTDLYHDKPYIYRRDADGYLLYTCGPNGKDDGGSGQFSNKLAGRWLDFDEQRTKQIPAGADDISLRLPTPPFKLPEPLANP